MGRSGRAHITYVLLAGAVMLAAAGGSAVGLGAPGWLAGAVGTVSALVAGVIVDRVDNARDTRGGAVEARRRVLDALTAPVPADQEKAAAANRADPLALLRADRSPMPFRGRGRQLRQLAEWRGDEKASPVLLLSGSAGVGKSRLAIEFGRRAPEGWAAGWLHAGAGDAVVAAVTACGDPAVILVDDADGRTDLVPLLNRLAERHGEPVVRVILVTRSAAGLRAALTTQVEERHSSIVSGAIALELEPEGGQDDQNRWFGEAVRTFATALELPAPALAEVFRQSRSAATAPFVLIQAQALLAVLAASGQIDLPVGGATKTIGGGAQKRDPRELSFGEIAEALMGHERRRWDALAAAWEWGAGGLPVEALRVRAIVALALLGADGDAEAEEVLGRVPQLRDATAERLFTIASWAAALYPASTGPAPRIRPDLVGEWFVVSRLIGDPALAQSLRAAMSDGQAARALGLLARAADWIEEAGPLFGEFAGDDVRRQVLAAAQAAKTGESGRHLLDTVVAIALASAGDWSLDQLAELDGLIPAHVLLLTHAEIAERVVALYRALATDDPAAYQAVFAAALENLGIWLDRIGRYQEALDAAQESVTHFRALANENPAAHLASLATALSNLGGQLDQVGRYQEALGAGQESVTLLRSLANANPAAHQANLAAALANLGIRLNQVGQYQEALDAAQESVTLRRTLANENPAAHLASLATALINLGVQLDRVGRYQEALSATRESVTLLRTLANANPAAHQAGLATALINLGVRLDRVGRYQEALDAARESVTLLRTLAAINPAAHQGNLATALTNLGARFDRVGRHQEALDATQESVTLLRTLAAANPAAHQDNLATALANLGVYLGRVGRHPEALNAQTESVRVYRELAARDPDLYQAGYQRRLGALRREYEQRGMRYEAIFHDLDDPSVEGGMDGGEAAGSVRDESDG